MNSIIKILNDAGYKNNNTAKERAVKNLNMLIDSGILQINLIPCDVYNSKENGRGFWFDCNDGKRRSTAYKITVYGKTYYGHTMEKSRITKSKKSQNWDGTWEYYFNKEYFNNTTISITDIQNEVARVISIIRDNKDFFSPSLFANKGNFSCGKCNGLGVIDAFSYYANGICFDCGGSGVNRDVLKAFINNNMKLQKI